MLDFNTKLINALLKNEPLDGFFRDLLENTINELLSAELSEFLGYEKYSSDGWGSGNSRNGFYSRSFDTKYGTLNLKIPRDRKGSFQQKLIPEYDRRSDDLETTIIQLYRKGITTREISDLIEKMYGHHYSPASVSNISKSVKDQVLKFHSRTVSSRYAVIFCDATYLNLRRDSVAKEALHVLLGITPDGKKEVIDYALYPTEAASNYEEMLRELKQRGLKEVLLFVSDGLTGIRDALLRLFPCAEHQTCWVHVSRTVYKLVRVRDRKDVLSDLKKIYTQEGSTKAQEMLHEFLEKYKKTYPKLIAMLECNPSLLSFYKFPKAIRNSIYSSNLIENNNKGLKHKAKVKEQFPNEESLERFICCYYCDYNRKHADHTHKGFLEAESDITAMFEQKYPNQEKSDTVAV